MVILVGASVVFSALGDRMNQNQMLGCLVFWAFLMIWASFMFWAGSWPLLPRLATEPQTRVPFALGAGGLLFAIGQIPLWSLLTQRFPPDKFTEGQAVLATGGVVVSLFAPAAPIVIKVTRQLWTVNLEQRRKIKEKKNRSQPPAAPYSEPAQRSPQG